MKTWLKTFIISTLVIMLGACSISEEEAQQHAKESFVEKMEQEQKSITYETNKMSLYIPSFTEIEEVDEYNLILERNGHVYLLFLNDFTDFQSKEELLELLMVEDEPFIFEMLESNNGEMAYLLVTHFSEDEYKVVVGYGGRKITTITKLTDMNNVADLMFDIVQSAKEKE